MTEKIYLTVKDLAARYRRKSHKTIEAWVREGKFPQPVKMVGCNLWELSVVEAFEQQQDAKKCITKAQ